MKESTRKNSKCLLSLHLKVMNNNSLKLLLKISLNFGDIVYPQTNFAKCGNKSSTLNYFCFFKNFLILMKYII